MSDFLSLKSDNPQESRLSEVIRRSGGDTRSSYFEVHIWPPGQGGCSSSEELSFLVDDRGGQSNTICFHWYVSLLYFPILISYDYVLFV